MKYFYKVRKMCIFMCTAILLVGALGMMQPLEVSAAVKKVTSVELNYHAYVLKPKQTVKLSVTCLPKTAKNRGVKWKSSNKSVAAVSSSGKVTAKKAGTAKITVTAKDGSGKKAVCTIKVVKKLTKIKEIKLSAAKKVIESGTKLEIKADIKPAKATLRTLKWESSNEKIATVSQKGVVCGLAEGTVKITAKAQDASKKKAVYTIKVEKKQAENSGTTENPSNDTKDPSSDTKDPSSDTKDPSSDTKDPSNDTKDPIQEKVPVSQITLKESEISIRAGKTQQLVAAVVPENATEKGIIWNSSDSNAVSVNDNGVITAIAEGKSAVITATAKDGSQVNTSCRVTVLPAEDSPSDIEDPIQEKVPVSQITLEESEISIRAGKTQQLVAAVVPENATEKGIIWSSSDSNAVSVNDDGVITAIAEGKSAIITATAKDGSQVSTNCKVTVLPAKESAANHAGIFYVYELDRNALQYQKIYTEEGKESTTVTNVSDVARSVFKMGLAVRNGIQTPEAFYNMIRTSCEENTFALFGMENFQIKECAADYSSITLQTSMEEGMKTLTIENIKILEAEKAVTDPNGLSTKASRVQFSIGDEELILEVYYNGSRIAIYRPNYSSAHFEFYVDNTNYQYVMRMTKLFNGILMEEIDTFPNFKYLDIYNIY